MDRADEARDRVLAQMVEDGYITAEQEAAAKKAKLKFVNGGVDSSSAPYFVDMVKDHLLEKFSETDLETQSYRIYTTLDPGSAARGERGGADRHEECRQAACPPLRASGRRRAKPCRRRRWRWWCWIRTPARFAR